MYHGADLYIIHSFKLHACALHLMGVRKVKIHLSAMPGTPFNFAHGGPGVRKYVM